MLASEETTGATTAHRNFVRDQMHIERGAQTPHLLQIHRAVHGHAASTLHQGLDDDCADMRSTCLQQRFQFTCSTQRDLVCGTEENALFNELNLRANRPITTAVVMEHLQKAQDHNWVRLNKGALKDNRWKITQAGENAIDDLIHGG